MHIYYIIQMMAFALHFCRCCCCLFALEMLYPERRCGVTVKIMCVTKSKKRINLIKNLFFSCKQSRPQCECIFGRDKFIQTHSIYSGFFFTPLMMVLMHLMSSFKCCNHWNSSHVWCSFVFRRNDLFKIHKSRLYYAGSKILRQFFEFSNFRSFVLFMHVQMQENSTTDISDKKHRFELSFYYFYCFVFFKVGNFVLNQQ